MEAFDARDASLSAPSACRAWRLALGAFAATLCGSSRTGQHALFVEHEASWLARRAARWRLRARCAVLAAAHARAVALESSVRARINTDAVVQKGASDARDAVRDIRRTLRTGILARQAEAASSYLAFIALFDAFIAIEIVSVNARAAGGARGLAPLARRFAFVALS